MTDDRELRIPEHPPLGRRAGIDLFDALGTTRSIRRFTDEPVTDDDLATMMFAATRAPTGSNRQPVRWLVLRDGPSAVEARRLLGDAARRMWTGKRTNDGYEGGTGVDPASPKARMARAMGAFVDDLDRAPLIVLPALVRYRDPTPTEGGSVYPAVQNLLLAARGLGYGGVLTMFQGIVEDELREVLGVPEGVGLMATVVIGRPQGGHGPVRRRPLDEVVYEDRWEGAADWATEPSGTRHTSAGPPRRSGGA
ncbi:MAG: nitroreductase family protein [Actinomycetota bacterium]